MANAPCAILAINSLDRYNTGNTSSQNSTIKVLSALFYNVFSQAYPPNDFQITSPGALIYGYMNRLIVSQVQLQYGVPTVIPNRNDFFVFVGWYDDSSLDPPIVFVRIEIPYGYYTPDTLAGVLQLEIRQSDFGDNGFAPNFTVVYNPTENVFEFNTNEADVYLYFPGPIDIPTGFADLTDRQILNVLKTYRLLGIDETNSSNTLYGGLTKQVGGNTISFLYTPYVDIVSETLTKYQNIKDTDTSPNKLNSIVSRVYLMGLPKDNPIPGVPGSVPFTVVQDLNTPKVIRWSVDEAVNSLDFQLRDCYGDLLFFQDGTSQQPNTITETFFTEFQMTLMCVESERY